MLCIRFDVSNDFLIEALNLNFSNWNEVWIERNFENLIVSILKLAN